MARGWFNFWKADEGQDLIEYTLLLAGIILVCAAFLPIPQSTMAPIWSGANSTLSVAAS